MATTIGTFEVDSNDAAFAPFRDGTGERFYRKRITFRRPFQQAPQVAVSIAGFDIAADKNDRFKMHAQNVDTEGFELVMHTWADTQMWRAKAAWIAYAETPGKPDVVIYPLSAKTPEAPDVAR